MQILTNLDVDENELKLIRDALRKFIWDDGAGNNFYNKSYGAVKAIKMYESICNLIGN